MEKVISEKLMKRIIKAQKDEINGFAIYHFMSKLQAKKHPENAKILEQMSRDEFLHYSVWKKYTGRDYKAHVFWDKFRTVIMGFTFVLKSLEKGETFGQEEYASLKSELPEAQRMLDDEKRHEGEISSMLDEERLHYVGSMVLGLNDALVELTGAITGVTFSLQNSKAVALTGIVTGIAATLSMMASNYLAENAEGHKDAFKSSLYTGAAYLVTVALLVLPYLLFPDSMYMWAFAVMICEVVFEIAFFNYYISVAQEQKFFKHFLLMVSISLGVAAISYGIGLLANLWLGVTV
jgi:VIT1/CCC1 family predicted Fe2+/Mn2+ transporter